MSAKKVLAIAVAVISVYACQKDPVLNPQTILQKKSSPNYWTSAENTDNPYEHLAFGVYHNNCIEYFRTSSVNFTTESDWIEARFQLTLDFFCFGNDTVYCNSQIGIDELMKMDTIALNDSLFNLEVLKLPSNVYDDIQKLLDFFNTYSMVDYNSLKNAIEVFEASIIADTLKTDAYKEMLLISSQVARYSSLYWKEQIEQNFYGWEITNYSNVEWAKTTKHDIKGSIVGFLYGLGTSHPIACSIKGAPLSSISAATAATRQSI